MRRRGGARTFNEAHPDQFVGNVRVTRTGRVPAREPGERIPDWRDRTGGLDGKGVPPK